MRESSISHPIRELLAELARRDPGRKVFGAKKHQYQNMPLEEAEVRRFEAELGVSYPPEYREFLVNVGSGAGPYYGVLSPADALSELRGLVQEYEAEEDTLVSPAVAFPLTAGHLKDIGSRIAAGDKTPWVGRDWPCDGCLPICSQGCTFWSVLILSGEFTGSVWDLNNEIGFSGEWLPARRPPGWWEFGMPEPNELPPLPSPPTFREWFVGWIERCFADLHRI